ncbi:MAG: HPr family phosphocarrier protein [Planctomycetota bacterium]
MSKASSERIIQEEEFVAILATHAKNFLCFLNLLRGRDTRDWVKRHYNELMDRAHELETLLDDYGARNNRSFWFLGELVASLRGFGKAATMVKHLLGRYQRYHLVLSEELTREFFAETDRAIRFMNQGILTLMNALLKEFRKVGVRIPSEVQRDSTVAEGRVRESLPHNFDDEDAREEVQEDDSRVAKVASHYLSALEHTSGLRRERMDDPLALRRFVDDTYDEERARAIEAWVHSIQSKYDTYVKNTPLEVQAPSLPAMRGHASTALHLLEVATELTHFYVRHEKGVRSKKQQTGIARLIDRAEVLHQIVNYALFFAVRVLEAGRPFAEDALSLFVRGEELRVFIPENETLHARPISLIVRIVNQYETHVEMVIAGKSCSAASIMEIIMIAGDHPTAREIVFRGGAQPLQDLQLLFENGLGEGGLDRLPEQLSYLRG